MADEIRGHGTAPADLEAAAASAVEREWRRRPSAVTRVSSDVEETFFVDFDNGERAVLKVAEPHRGDAWFEFEAAIVDEAIDRDPALPLARGIATLDGRTIVATEFADSLRTVRLMRRLPGVPATDAPPDAPALRRIGRTAARLSLALAGVSHPVAARRVPWDLRGLEELAPGLALIPDARARAVAETVVDGIQPLLRHADALPAQVSHNDLNGGNLLVSPADPGLVTGIIDFGDAAAGPRAFDVGIAAAYATSYAGCAPWDAAAAITDGYRDGSSLTRDEVAAVPAIVRARLAQRVLVAARRRGTASAAPTRDNEAWLRVAQRDLLAVAETRPEDSQTVPKEWR